MFNNIECLTRLALHQPQQCHCRQPGWLQVKWQLTHPAHKQLHVLNPTGGPTGAVSLV